MKGKELLVYVKKVFEMESAIRIQEEVLKKSGWFCEKGFGVLIY